MYQQIGQFRIYFDEVYYLAYSGGTRELSSKDMKDYQRALSLPLIAQRNELERLGPDKNPNLVPIKGRDLLGFIIDGKYTPFFDPGFNQSRRLQINDKIVFEAMKAKSYELAMREGF